MKTVLSHIVLFLFLTQLLYAQEDGVVAFDLPVRNSLKFNRYAINPTFSFVREQNRYISFTNKREWVQFDNPPQTYLFSYSGRFRENMGVGIGVFQQNYGVLTTFGGVANFAYNVVLNSDNNLTFGMNLAFYKSGLNDGEVITNFPDSSLDNIPSNSIITVNPGLNYGTAFFDFGVSINNLAAYNLTSSKIIEDNPEQSIQGHVMYTGYLNSRGFFDESKFSTLLMSEFKKEKTVLSGLVMLTIPKGIWAQAGYNTLYGVSGGVGLNITNQISIEYNYEKALGELDAFGNSHEITLAYKFKNKYRYNYSSDDEDEALLISYTKRKPTFTKRKSVPNNQVDGESLSKADTKLAQAKVEEDRLKTEAQQAKLAEEEKLKAEAEKAKLTAEEETRLKAEEAAQAKLAEERRLKAEAEAEKARLLAEQKAAQAKLAEEGRLKAEAEARESKLSAEEEARLKAEEAAQAKLAEEERLKAETEKAKLLAEQEAKLKAEEAAQAKLAEEERLKAEAQQARTLAEQEAKLKAEEAAQAKLAEEERLKAEAQQARTLAEQEAKLKAEEAAQAKLAEEERLQAIAEEKTDTLVLDEVVIPVAKDKEALAMESLTELTENSKIEQQDLLIQLKDKIASKQQDLDDLKEENDLSEQGISSAPKAFKSVSAENAELQSLQLEIDNVIESQNTKISELEQLLEDRLKTVKNENEATNVYYSRKIEQLKSEQFQTIQSKETLLSNLEDIKVATEVERKRRIKRAAYDNQETRYLKDRAALQQIKQSTEVSSTPLTESDFDFGEPRSNNITIVKNIQNTESGYYLVLAVHSDVEKRDEFLRKAVMAGRSDIDFFFDVNTNKYYIYYKKFDDIERANRAIQSNGNEPYNSNLSTVKIEN
tara:strand:+ start:798 stop:3443 length:2646 start_codon:yes stop_codon:yes gene_type:complete